MKEPHPRVRSNGCVTFHTLVAESVIGRYLYDDEVVHHKDEDKHNNSPENLMVFRTQEDHARFHSGKYESLVENSDGSWSCNIGKQYCVVCGETIISNRDRKTCSTNCANETFKKCERPNKEDLVELLTENSFSFVGKMFNVSDNAIRKWCKGYGLSAKAKDYK